MSFRKTRRQDHSISTSQLKHIWLSQLTRALLETSPSFFLWRKDHKLGHLQSFEILYQKHISSRRPITRGTFCCQYEICVVTYQVRIETDYNVLWKLKAQTWYKSKLVNCDHSVSHQMVMCLPWSSLQENILLQQLQHLTLGIELGNINWSLPIQIL
jgi:hypothetical protein